MKKIALAFLFLTLATPVNARVLLTENQTFVKWAERTIKNKDRANQLSYLCAKGLFKPRLPGTFQMVFSDRKLDVAFGDGGNLVDKTNARDMKSMYVFRDNGTTACMVVELRSPFLKPEFQ